MTALAPAMYTTQALTAALQRKSEQLRPRTAGETLRVDLHEARLKKDKKLVKQRRREQERRDYQRMVLAAGSSAVHMVSDGTSEKEIQRHEDGDGTSHNMSLFAMSLPIESILSAQGHHSSDTTTTPTSSQDKPHREPRYDPQILLEAERQRLKHIDLRFRREAKREEEESSNFWRWYWQRHRDIDTKYIEQGVFVSSAVAGAGAYQTPHCRSQRTLRGSTPWGRRVDYDDEGMSPLDVTGGPLTDSAPRNGYANDRSSASSPPLHNPNHSSSMREHHHYSQASAATAAPAPTISSSFHDPSQSLRRQYDAITSSVLFRPPPYIPGIDSSDDEKEEQESKLEKPAEAKGAPSDEASAVAASKLQGYSESHKRRLLNRAIGSAQDEQVAETRETATNAHETSVQLKRRTPKVSTIVSNPSYLPLDKNTTTIPDETDEGDKAANVQPQEERHGGNNGTELSALDLGDDDVLATAALRAQECMALLSRVKRTSRLHYLHMEDDAPVGAVAMEKDENSRCAADGYSGISTSVADPTTVTALSPSVTTPASNPYYLPPKPQEVEEDNYCGAQDHQQQQQQQQQHPMSPPSHHPLQDDGPSIIDFDSTIHEATLPIGGGNITGHGANESSMVAHQFVSAVVEPYEVRWREPGSAEKRSDAVDARDERTHSPGYPPSSLPAAVSTTPVVQSLVVSPVKHH